MDGISKRLDPGPPVNENSYLKEEIPEIPRNLREALNELNHDVELKGMIGERLIDEFLKVKMAEVDEYEGNVTEWEYKIYSKM
jgi:glutamine synthetase